MDSQYLLDAYKSKDAENAAFTSTSSTYNSDRTAYNGKLGEERTRRSDAITAAFDPVI